MMCPYCGNDAQISDVVFRNIESYGGPCKARSACCGKVLIVYPVLTFRCEETVQPKKDDWGN